MAPEAGVDRDMDSASQPLLSTETSSLSRRELLEDTEAHNSRDEERSRSRGRDEGASLENNVDGDGSRPTRFVWLLTGVAGISGVLFGYDTGIISSTLLALSIPASPDGTIDLPLGRPLTTWDKSLITSITSLGALAFSPISGPVADLYGRQKTLHFAASLFIAGALVQAFAGSVVVMVIGRLIVGMAVGLSSGAAGVYVAESAPARWRGRMVVVTALGITAGQVVAYVIGWLLGMNWRWMVGLGALPAIAQIVGLTILRAESPRWLVSAKGDLEAARRVLERIYGGQSGTVETVLVGMRREATTSGKVGKVGMGERVRELVGESVNRKALMIACLLQGAQQICGFNTLMYFSATIFAAVGFSDPTATALLIASTNFLFTIAAFGLIDRVGRRRILLLSIPFMAIGLAVSAIAFGFLDIRFEPTPPSSSPDLPPEPTLMAASSKSPAIILPPLLLFVAAYALGLGNVPWQQPELFSSSVRAMGAAFATSTNWAANAVVGATFLPLMEKVGAPATLMGYAVICGGIWYAIWKVFPERMGVELERVGTDEADEDDHDQ